MTKDELFAKLAEEYRRLLAEHGLENETVQISCRALSKDEAIGETKRKDFPILTGKDVMIQAEYRSGKGQAFTDAPTVFCGRLSDICALDLSEDSHNRGVFIACLNAVMNSLGLCSSTVHCRKEGPEECSLRVKDFLDKFYGKAERIGLVGYQPALLEMLAGSGRKVRVLDLNPDNIGSRRYGITVEDGRTAKDDIIRWADLILCTGSTLCNGTIVDYLEIPTEVLFYGITAAGTARLLNLKRICFADDLH